MGDLHKNSQTSHSRSSKCFMTKGQRLGWIHESSENFHLMSRSAFKYGVRLRTYSEGPFSNNKIVP